MNLPPIETSPKLLALMEKARSHKMTPAEIDAQRRSWARGNMMLDNTEMTAEQVDAALGPSLADLLATARTEARNAALEEAAKVAWLKSKEGCTHEQIASAIRALIGTDTTTDRGEA